MNSQEKQSVIIGDSTCEKGNCCSTSEDGNAICIVPSKSERVNTEAATCACGSGASGCGCHTTSTAQLVSLTEDAIPLHLNSTANNQTVENRSTWQKIRGGVMLTIACIASPCCSVLLVPIVLTLLAGTPVAVWVSHNLGLVYGGLTLLSILSFVLAFRWLTKSSRRTGSTKNPSMSASPKNEISSQTL